LIRLFENVVRDFDCSVLEGHRSEARQRELYAAGKSKVSWPHSKHNKNPSMAGDVAPYPIDWEDEGRFYYFAGFVLARAASMGISIRWGGDWNRNRHMDDQDFNDLVHFELFGAKYEGLL